LYEIYGEEKRTLINLNDIPKNVRNATIAIEDKKFYNHGGFSVWAILRTIVTNVFLGKSAGGSTLTQQFVKNAILTNEKSYIRKAKELILAYQLEKKFTKDEILQLYLNEIPYGSTAYGVESASQRFFGKSVRDVSLPEAAILAAIPQAPSRYSPFGPNRELLLGRQKYILDQMAKQGYISQDEADKAKKTEVIFSKPKENILAPHFVMYLKEYLSDKYGEKTIEQGGLKIISSIDLDKQKAAEEVISAREPQNETKYNATNAALVSIDPKTGQILAMVGSKDYFSNKIDGQVNITTSPRQPGSSFKPIVYAAAFIKGYTPNTILYDVVTNFSTDPSTKYEPHNYDNTEHGPVSMRKALAGSLNIPAVKTIYLVGIKNVITLAQTMGYSTLRNPDQYGLSLVLGGGEIQLLEHANAYSAFAQDGYVHQISPVLRVEDQSGKVLEEYQEQKTKVFEPQIARQVTSVLSDNNARAYIFGLRNNLILSDRPVAAKTGTTNDYKDAWTVGYTPSIVTGVWVGNNDNTSMKRGADGSVVAAPIWHDYMEKVLKNTPKESFIAPENNKTGKPVLDGNIASSSIIKIDKASGLLATEDTPPSYIVEKNFSQPHNILYYIDKTDPRGPYPANPALDPQFNLWETPVRAWAQKHKLIATGTPPTEKDNVHKVENRPVFTIEEPYANQTITDNQLRIKLSALTAPRGVARISFTIDSVFIGEVTTYPFGMEKDISFLDSGFHQLSVTACDDVDNCSTQTINFNNSNSATILSPTITWLPLSNSSSTNSSTPINLQLSITSPERVTKLTLSYTINNKTTDITTLQLPGASPSYNWIKPINKGVYQLNATAYTWGKEEFLAPPLTLTIK